MKRIITTITILLFLALQSMAGVAYSDIWNKANQLYQHREYDSAANYYEQIAAQNPQDAVVYYNLGNTYYKLNRIGVAVLNYERALRIQPDYKEAKDNLILTQSRISNRMPVVNDIFFVQWWKSLVHGNHANVFAVLCLLVFLAIIGLLLKARLYKNNTLIQTRITGILGCVFGVLLILAFASANNKTKHNKAVVIQSDAPLINNQTQGKQKIYVPEGTIIELKTESSENNGLVEVMLPDGRYGWMQKNLITKI